MKGNAPRLHTNALAVRHICHLSSQTIQKSPSMIEVTVCCNAREKERARGECTVVWEGRGKEEETTGFEYFGQKSTSRPLVEIEFRHFAIHGLINCSEIVENTKVEANKGRILGL